MSRELTEEEVDALFAPNNVTFYVQVTRDDCGRCSKERIELFSDPAYTISLGYYRRCVLNGY